MKPFAECSWRGKLRRLRGLALNALQQYDLEIDRLDLLATDTNILYRVTTRANERFALRLANPHWRDWEAALSEVMWLDALAGDTDIHVPHILRAAHGAALVRPQAAGAPHDWHALLMSWQPGMLLGRRLDLRHLTSMGMLFARLHRHSEGWQPPDGFSARKFSHYISRGERQLLFTPERRAIYARQTARRLQQMHEAVTAAYTALDPADLRVIHCDLWHDNIKLYRGELYPFDFEDTIRGFRLHDIAMAMLDLFEDAGESRYYALLAAFREGYTRLLPWPEGEMVLFQLGRMLWILNYIALNSPAYLSQAADFYAHLFERYQQTGRLVPPVRMG